MLRRHARSSFVPYFVLLILFIPASFACRPGRDTGHTLLRQETGRDSALTFRNRLNVGISIDDFKAGVFSDGHDEAIHYRLLAPKALPRDKKAPLVIVYHGSGATGTDNLAQMGILARLWAKPGIREKYPAYVLVPQFPRRSSNYSPDATHGVLVSQPDPCLIVALKLVDSLMKSLPIDERRIYVLGFSMGGSSTINSLDLRPDLFAAAISISGIPTFHRLQNLPATPLWLIHGNADTENPFPSDSLFYQTLKNAGDEHVCFWEIDGLDHQIYMPLFTTGLIPEWLFRHSK